MKHQHKPVQIKNRLNKIHCEKSKLGVTTQNKALQTEFIMK